MGKFDRIPMTGSGCGLPEVLQKSAAGRVRSLTPIFQSDHPAGDNGSGLDSPTNFARWDRARVNRGSLIPRLDVQKSPPWIPGTPDDFRHTNGTQISDQMQWNSSGSIESPERHHSAFIAEHIWAKSPIPMKFFATTFLPLIHQNGQSQSWPNSQNAGHKSIVLSNTKIYKDKGEASLRPFHVTTNQTIYR